MIFDIKDSYSSVSRKTIRWFHQLCKAARTDKNRRFQYYLSRKKINSLLQGMSKGKHQPFWCRNGSIPWSWSLCNCGLYVDDRLTLLKILMVIVQIKYVKNSTNYLGKRIIFRNWMQPKHFKLVSFYFTET